MYRDDPLADEEELRATIGDDAVDDLLEAGESQGMDVRDEEHPVAVAVDVLRVLQGWVDEDEAAAWFAAAQQRLEGRSPVDALIDGDGDEVRDVARRWAAAQT